MLTETVQAYCNPDEVSIPDVDKWCLRNQANGKKKQQQKPHKKRHTKKLTTTKETHKQS